MKTKKDSISISQARQGLPELIEKTGRLHRRYFITRRGRVEAVIISAEEMESWEETLEIVSNGAEMRSLKAALKDIRNGKTKTFKDYFGEDL